MKISYHGDMKSPNLSYGAQEGFKVKFEEFLNSSDEFSSIFFLILSMFSIKICPGELKL